MSISKVSSFSLVEDAETTKAGSKWKTYLILIFITVSILSALDLLLAFVREDTLSMYTMSIVFDLTLSALGLLFCSDLILDKDQDSIICFLAYMIFLWVCTTVLKLVFQL